MNHKLLIRVLELLEETYPECYHAERLIKKLNIFSYKGEFSKVIKYLTEKNKINVIFKDSIGSCLQWRILQQGDKISITPDGIDFLIKIRLIEINKRLNKIIVWATGIIAISTFVNVCVHLLFKFRIL